MATINQEDQHDNTMSSSSSSSSIESEDELQNIQLVVSSAASSKNRRCCLSKQLSLCKKSRDIAWERRRLQEHRRGTIEECCDDLTDEDLYELKGCIQLGFGFNEEDGQKLCNTLPALDLYFAVNRGLSPSPVSSPRQSTSLGCRSSSFGNLTRSDDSWKICSPGDDPELVKAKLRHWAQAVACSVMQSS